MNKALFLDRDGVINENKNHGVSSIEELVFLPNVFKALKKVKNYKKIIITNQANIERGFYTEKDLANVHKYMLEQFSKNNIQIDGIFYCPHKPEENCKCRKPKTAMIEKAKEKFNIDLKESWVIGDKTSDIKLGKNAGCRTVLVKTGHAGKDGYYNATPHYKADNLLEAIKIIKRQK